MPLIDNVHLVQPEFIPPEIAGWVWLGNSAQPTAQLAALEYHRWATQVLVVAFTPSPTSTTRWAVYRRAP